MISDLGRVFSIKRNKFLKLRINKEGYYYVILYNYDIVKNFRVHKLVAQSFLENKGNLQCVDHINNNKTDNRLDNLRYATSQLNNHNTRIRKDNTTGVKGISFHKKCNKYYVRIMINKKQKHIGCFTTLEQATIARKKVANELFGEFTHSSEKY
jgi:hypothetical protein